MEGRDRRRRRRHWAAGRVSDSSEGGVSGCLSCCSVLLVGLAGCPVPSGRGGAVSDRVFRACSGLGLRGGGVPDGLASCGGGPSDRPSRSLRVAPASFRPGARPARPGPARPEGELRGPPGGRRAGRGVCQGAAGPGRGGSSPPVACGRLRAAIPIASHTRGRCRVWSSQWRPRLLSSCSSPGTVARQIEHLPGCGYRWMSPTHLLSRLAGGGSPRRAQAAAHHGDRPDACPPRRTQVRARAPTGTPCAKEGSRFSPSPPPNPGLSQPGAQPPALSRPLRTDLGAHGLRAVPSPIS